MENVAKLLPLPGTLEGASAYGARMGLRMYNADDWYIDVDSLEFGISYTLNEVWDIDTVIQDSVSEVLEEQKWRA